MEGEVPAEICDAPNEIYTAGRQAGKPSRHPAMNTAFAPPHTKMLYNVTFGQTYATAQSFRDSRLAVNSSSSSLFRNFGHATFSPLFSAKRFLGFRFVRSLCRSLLSRSINHRVIRRVSATFQGMRLCAGNVALSKGRDRTGYCYSRIDG